MQSPGPTDGSVIVRLVFKEETDALSAVRKFNGETADGRTLIVRSVGGQPVNLAARLDVGPAKDGSVDALITSPSTSYVLQTVLTNSVELIGVIEKCVRMTSWLKIRELRCWSPHRVPIPRTMFSNPPGVVEMAGVAVAVAQNVEARVAISPLGWMLIDLLSFRVTMICSSRAPDSMLHYAYRTVCNLYYRSSLSHYGSTERISNIHLRTFPIHEIPVNCEIG